MKWARQWRSELEKLPTVLQQTSINYKQWKKVLQVCQDQTVLQKQLWEDIQRVDTLFRNHYSHHCHHAIVKGWSWLRCLWQPLLAGEGDKDAWYKYVMINRTSIAKITKRSDKLCGTRLREWYNSERSKLAICESYMFKKLQLEVCGLGESAECPICLEPLTHRTVVILDCGHCVCLGCIKEMLHIHHLKGTLQNLVSYAAYHLHTYIKCPLCRRTARTLHHTQVYNR